MSSGSPRPPSSPPGSPLPSYLAHHIDLGFDADDVSALISAIDSSQGHESEPSLPRLPAEVLFHILQFVSIEYILQWRSVCRGFRDCIDGPVMYSYIRRAELIGSFRTLKEFQAVGLDETMYERVGLVRCKFRSTERTAKDRIRNKARYDKTKPERDSPIWDTDHAVFNIDDTWHQEFLEICESFPLGNQDRNAWDDCVPLHDFYYFSSLESDSVYGKILKLHMHLDDAVLELEPLQLSYIHISTHNEKEDMEIHDNRVSIGPWRAFLLDFTKRITLLNNIMDQTRGQTFTFGHEEDCLRDIRRQRIFTDLNRYQRFLTPASPNNARRRWQLQLLPSLYGNRKQDHPAAEFRQLERAENESMAVLMRLRREARMSREERDRLFQLAEDRKMMISEINKVQETYKHWVRQGLGDRSCLLGTYYVPRVPLSPFAWSDSLRKTEEKRVNRWKLQQKNMQQVTMLLEASIEAVSIPEDAFDGLGSDD